MYIIVTFLLFSLIFAITLIFLLILCIIYSNYNRERKFKIQKYLNQNSKILITGGCLGIGRQLIHQLITLFKCHIINIDIRESEFKELNDKYKDKITNINYDISKINDIKKFFEDYKINPDEIDIIINNAAIANNLPIAELKENQMISTIQINLLFPMKLISFFIKNLQKKQNLNGAKVHFVTLCSVMSHVVSANSSDYICSKWGLYGFVESLRSEYLYDERFIFTTICPFAVDTGMFPNFMFCLDKVKVSKDIIKSIALKESIKFIPNYINIPIYVYKLIPLFFRNLFEYYIINPFTKKLGRRTDNDYLLNKKND